MFLPGKFEKWLILSLLLVSLVAGLFTVFQRWSLEKQYNQYELVLDYDDLRMLAVLEERPLAQVLLEFKEAGVTGLSIPIQTVAGLLAQGEISYQQGELEAPPEINLPSNLSELTYDRSFVGPDPKALGLAQAAGLSTVYRIPFFPRATSQEIRQAFADLRDKAGHSIIFDGQKVLGYPERLYLVRELIHESDLLLGEVEFSGQRGMEVLSTESTNNLVRVHTITGEEMDQIDYDRAIARWVRAVRERNVRLLYLHSFLPDSAAVKDSGEEPLDLSLQMTAEVKGQLKELRYRAGNLQRFPSYRASLGAFFLVTLGLLAGTYLLLRLLLQEWWRREFAFFLWAAGVVIVCGLNILYLLDKTVLAGQVVALGAAVVFPALAILRAEGNNKGRIYSLFTALTYTLEGMVIVVTALAQSPFMLQVEQFLGVKLMHVLPPAIVAFFLWKKGYFQDWRWNRLTLIGLILAIFAGGYLILRTGNISAVADWERELRDALESLLVIRPRTKEILIGHPALVLALWLQSKGTNKVISGLLLTAASIGLLSILNTFTHAHTPLLVSILRTVNGLAVGLVIGFLAILAYEGLARFIPGLRSEEN